MIAKFDSAADLMAHYAALRQRLRPTIKPVVNPIVLQRDPEPELIEILPPPIPVVPMIRMAVASCDPAEVRIQFEEVVGLVCSHLGYTRREIFADRRFQKLCFDRQMLWALAHKHCLHMSLPQIGRASGDRDHTTVLHGRKRGVKHPDYAILDQALTNLYEEKIRANAALLDREAEVVNEGVC